MSCRQPCTIKDLPITGDPIDTTNRTCISEFDKQNCVSDCEGMCKEHDDCFAFTFICNNGIDCSCSLYYRYFGYMEDGIEIADLLRQGYVESRVCINLDPSAVPSTSPSVGPSVMPSVLPSVGPSTNPSSSPSTSPSVTPSTNPSASPSKDPTSASPSASPSHIPSVCPTEFPTVLPTVHPSSSAPTTSPSSLPTDSPTPSPTRCSGNDCGEHQSK